MNNVLCLWFVKTVLLWPGFICLTAQPHRALRRANIRCFFVSHHPNVKDLTQHNVYKRAHMLRNNHTQPGVTTPAFSLIKNVMIFRTQYVHLYRRMNWPNNSARYNIYTYQWVQFKPSWNGFLVIFKSVTSAWGTWTLKSSHERLTPSTSNVLAPPSVGSLCCPMFTVLLHWVRKMPLCNETEKKR